MLPEQPQQRARCASVMPADNQIVSRPVQDWTSASPPTRSPDIARLSRSWLYVPALLHRCGLLQLGAARCWDTAETVGPLWRAAQDAMSGSRRADSGVVAAVLAKCCDSFRNMREQAEHRCLESLLAQAAAREVTLREVMDAVAQPGMYIPAVTQEFCVAFFGGFEAVRQFNAIVDFLSSVRPAAAPPAAPHARPCFVADPEGEVAWCTQRLLSLSDREALQAWRGLPMYTEYIAATSLDAILNSTLSNLETLATSSISVDSACGMAARLGSIVPLPLAVAWSFAAAASGQPEYFLMDLTFTLLANLLHPDVAVTPFPQDTSTRIKPRYWSTPTGNTTAGKSPTFDIIEKLFLETTGRLQRSWPFAHLQSSNICSDGSHGMFNEKVRAALRRPVFGVARVRLAMTPTIRPFVHSPGRSSARPSDWLTVPPSARPTSVCPSARPSVRQTIQPPDHPSIWPSDCPFARPPARPCACAFFGLTSVHSTVCLPVRPSD